MLPNHENFVVLLYLSIFVLLINNEAVFSSEMDSVNYDYTFLNSAGFTKSILTETAADYNSNALNYGVSLQAYNLNGTDSIPAGKPEGSKDNKEDFQLKDSKNQVRSKRPQIVYLGLACALVHVNTGAVTDPKDETLSYGYPIQLFSGYRISGNYYLAGNIGYSSGKYFENESKAENIFNIGIGTVINLKWICYTISVCYIKRSTQENFTDEIDNSKKIINKTFEGQGVLGRFYFPFIKYCAITIGCDFFYASDILSYTASIGISVSNIFDN